MKKKWAVMLAIGLALCGCATTPVWDRTGPYTEAQFQQDWAQCRYEVELNMQPSSYRNAGEAIGAGIVDGLREKELLHRCMEARGWHMVPRQ